MARHQVRVLATSDEAAELAQQRLATRGAVDCVGAFKLGWADDADVQDLEAVGCVVELIPPDPKLGWLEPGEQPVSLPADALSDEGRSPVLASLAGTSPDYYVVQFAGPLHPQWCEQVQKLGIKIGQSVPGFANKMALTPQQKEELELLALRSPGRGVRSGSHLTAPCLCPSPQLACAFGREAHAEAGTPDHRAILECPRSDLDRPQFGS